ncbi:sugar transporter domain-containing protein [Sarocladium implicatum]|nr:sugar transporter domain-containing protein [Sarocladium implicatum]
MADSKTTETGTTTNQVTLTSVDLSHFDANDPAVLALVEKAKASQDADHQLTVWQAIKKYKVAASWAMFLSTALVMEGFDLTIIGSFYGQTQFLTRFGEIDSKTGNPYISAAWVSGLSNSSVVGQVIGLIVNGWAQDRFGCRPTIIFFMLWLAVFIFVPVFSQTLAVLCVGQIFCGIGFGVFQTLTTSYACEVVPTVLRPYVTAYVCMCWGAGILLSSGTVRATLTIDGDWAWRLPFCLQWIWPIPIALGAYLAPESPWNSVRRGKMDEARKSLIRLRQKGPDAEAEVEASLAYIIHTTNLEMAETEGGRFIDCFRGTNLRRTEINAVVWAAQILCGNALLGFVIVFLQSAGWSEEQSFNLNIALSACYIIGGMVCWLMFPHIGRATIYMGGLVFMFCCLIVIGALGFYRSPTTDFAVGIVFVISTLCNMITTGPACYPIVAETPSGKLRYKTISIGRVVYNLTGMVNNILTPRMVLETEWDWGAKSGLFYAATNLLCLIWCYFRLPETKDRTFGEIDLLFENHVPARKFKTTVVNQFEDYEKREKSESQPTVETVA